MFSTVATVWQGASASSSERLKGLRCGASPALSNREPTAEGSRVCDTHTKIFGYILNPYSSQLHSF
eukprot:SAG31_NODE_21352_length_551_cov_10.884956_1_plen_65_part_10